jgi:transposase-like protein
MAKEEPAMARPLDRDKEQFWRQMFGRWTASGLSIAAFCEDAGLSQQSFYRWRRVLRKRSRRLDQQRPQAVDAATEKAATAIARPLPLFVPLAVESMAAAAVLEVVVRGGRVIRVPAGFDAPTLAQVLAVLEGQSC